MIKRIPIQKWLELKPYSIPVKTDSYYLKICNDINKIVRTNRHAFILQRYLDNKDINLLSCFLTSYFEDLTSETNIWNSFVRIHHRLYGKQLPFYNLDEYYEEEVNHQDISFLIWYFLNTVQGKNFISPFNDFIIHIAEKIFDVFENEWETAPKNVYLKSYYQINQKENDFYIARNLINTVLFGTYLFYPDIVLKLKEQEVKIIKNNKDKQNKDGFINDNRVRTIHESCTCLLALKGKEWVSEILGSDHLLSKDFLSMSKRIQGYFLYKGQDKNDIFLEHIATGKKFNLTKKSFDHSHTLNDVDVILFIGMVMWKEEWWFSGVFFQQPYNPNLISKEKNSLESKITVNFLDQQKGEIDKMLSKQLSVFKDFNNGSQIAFLPAASIDKFYKEFYDFFNNTIAPSGEKVKEITLVGLNDGTNDAQKDFPDVSEKGLAFFNPNGGGEIALGINSAFPMSINPYFKEEDSNEDVISLFMGDSFSKELAMYCIDNCKTKLSFFTKGVGKNLLEDMDFLLRFWKKDNYHTLPSIADIE